MTFPGACTGKELLQSWLNKSMKIKMTDGRTLIGLFLCTDKDRNVILGSCEEYLKPPGEGGKKEEPRILGLAMVPGHHIVSIQVDALRDVKLL
ncbi:N-alpha-acetyltransferase 38-B, NatC auxiliary subunit-like isoform X1 [Dreissena polymorpha]|uniref:N-alpha-acetyltransferase 38-B, NatC auxiliary subunit-like isoform X1 n=1 Tax=Dreissena polymorpha TaxID=45954 RepID=UPI002264498E|nr:N-alpha-acetyltransferase 38-B, NatC auxiliary subunit-like isoform X1 [Dreissena polymorpha]